MVNFDVENDGGKSVVIQIRSEEVKNRVLSMPTVSPIFDIQSSGCAAGKRRRAICRD